MPDRHPVALLDFLLATPLLGTTSFPVAQPFLPPLIKPPVMKEKFKQQSLMQNSGEIMADILSDDMKTSDTETSIELNFAGLKFKHASKRKPD